MMKSKQQGSLQIIILVVVIALVAGLIAWKVAETMNTQNDTDVAINSNENTPETSQNVISVNEWNVNFELPDSIKKSDVTYTIIGSESQAFLSLKSKMLANTDPTCNIPETSKGQFIEIRKSKDADNENGNAGIKIGDWYYFVTSTVPNGDCYDSATIDKYYSTKIYESVQNSLKES